MSLLIALVFGTPLDYKKETCKVLTEQRVPGSQDIFRNLTADQRTNQSEGAGMQRTISLFDVEILFQTMSITALR